MTKVVKNTLPNFPENQEVMLMSCFVAAAYKSSCKDCGGTNFETVYDRRLKSKIPICSDCEGDPTMYRVAYTIKVKGESKKRFRTKNNLGEKLDDPFKAAAYLNYVREKIASEGEAFDVRTVGTSKERASLLVKNYSKEYIQMRETDLDDGLITPSGMSKIEKNFRLYIVPLFGDSELKDLSFKKVRTTLEKARMAGNSKRRLSLSQKKEIVGVLKPFLKHASREEVIKGVPELPSYVVPEAFTKEDFYTFKEIMLILDNVENRDAQIALTLCAFYSRRRGEVESLCWKDINFEDETITFARHVSDGKKYGKKTIKGLKASPGKSITFDFFPGVREMLIELIPSFNGDDNIFKNCGLKGKGFGKSYVYDQWRASVEMLMNKQGRNKKPLIDKYCDVHRGCRNSVLTSAADSGASNEFLENLYAGDRKTLEKHYLKRRKQNTSSFDIGATLVQLSKQTTSGPSKIRQIG